MSVRGSSVGWIIWGVALLLATMLPLAAQDDAYHQALLNYKAGNYAAARLAIDDAEKARPTDLATAVLKGHILTEQRDFDAGEKTLRRFLGPNGPPDVQLALGDLFLRKRDFGAAANMYDQTLHLKPNDPDITLKLIYAKINTADLVTAVKYASQLKPLDPVNPAYYFAHAALSEATGKESESEQDIETCRTIYGLTVTNRYLKTYLEVTSRPKADPASRVSAPATNAPAVPAHP